MNSSDAFAFGSMGVIVLFYIVIFALVMAIYWKIVSKAGYPGWYALGMLVPCLNLVLIIMFAFVEWPIERELNYLRSQQGYQPYPRYPGSPPQ